MLEAAQLRIEVLSGFDAEGNPVTQPLDEKVMTLEEKADARSRRRSSEPAEPADGHPGAEVDVSGRLF
jgi:hypothetical protein